MATWEVAICKVATKEVATWEVATWEVALRKLQLEKLPFGKLSLGKLPLEKTFGRVPVTVSPFINEVNSDNFYKLYLRQKSVFVKRKTKSI